MKILMISNIDAGLYLFRAEIIQRFIAEGHEVHILSSDTGFTDRLKSLGAKVTTADIDRRGTNPVKDIALYKKYRSCIKNTAPDVVLTYTIKPIVYGGVAAARLHVPVLANITGISYAMNDGRLISTLLKVMYKAGLKRAKCVFFQNRSNMEFMEESGCIPKKTPKVLLPGSGVNLEKFSPLPYPDENTGIRLLYMGRIFDTKGSMELLEMIEDVHNRHPEVSLDLVGGYEKGFKDKYAPLIEKLTETGAVRLHEFTDDVRSFYEKCHALIHPAYMEGMSNVVLEAAASSRCVITSRIPGCMEIYEDGVGGIGFERANVKSLTDAVERFLGMTHEEKEKMGIRAREYVEKHFDRNIVAEEYLKQIRGIR